MTEPTDNLESRLVSLRPRSVSPSLETTIAQSSDAPAPTRAAVSLFWATVAGGAIAASTILVLLSTHSTHPAHRQQPEFAVVNPHISPANLTTLASADWRWGDDLNLNESRRLP